MNTEENLPRAPDDGSVTQMFAQFREGDDAALAPLWQRFFPRLQGLAREILSRHLGRSAGADDAVQEAFVSFWKHVRAGEFLENVHRDHLWGLLAQFTVYKAKRLARRESAEKRGGGRVVCEADLLGDSQAAALAEFVLQPAAEVDDLAAELLESLPEELREFAVLRLIGHSTAEIADLFECTQRKVQRKLELVRMHWERLLPAE